MSEKQKSLWVQVMEAGFGETLRSCGYERVSPRLYRIEGEGLSWEQFTFRGLPTAEGSFREGYGLIVPEVNAIYEEFYGKPTLTHFGGRKFTKGYYGTMGMASENVGIARVFNSWFWRNFYSVWDFFSPRFYAHFLERETKYFKKHPSGYSEYWQPNGDDLSRVAAELSRVWLKYLWERQISYELKIQDFAHRRFGEDRLERSIFHLDSAVFNYAAGNTELCKKYLRRPIEISSMSEEEMRSFILSGDNLLFDSYKRGELEAFKKIKSRQDAYYKFAIDDAKDARKLAGIFSISL